MATGLAWIAPALALASGVAILLVGLPLLFLRSKRSHSLAFGVFCVVWGVQVVAGNVSQLTHGAASVRWTLVFVASTIVIGVPLAYFAASFTTPRGWPARSTRASVLLALPAVLGTILLVADPSLFVTRDASGDAGPGPFYAIFSALFFGSFVYALIALDRAVARAAAHSIDARRTTLVLVALLVYVSFASARTLVLFAGASPLLLLGGLAGAAASLWAGARLFRVRPLWAALAVALPAILGALWAITPTETSGLVRMTSAALIAYAILRFELFDIDARVKRIALASGVFVAGAFTLFVVEQALERALGSAGLALTLTQVLLVGCVGAVLVASPVAARALSGRVLTRVDAPERLDARRLEVYEAALAQSLSGEGLDASAPFLAQLRARLGVSDAEHMLLVRLVGRAPPPSPATLAPGARLANRYQLERLLGEGSEGAAWLATDETLRRAVVVKTLRPRAARTEAAARAFLREARLAAQLDNEHVVRVFDFGQEGDTPFLVIELVDGGTLEERLARGPLSMDESRRVIRGLLRGLAHVHERGLLHRDLKPANVLLTPSGDAKIGDFGVARDLADETQTGLESPAPKGTLSTMSPEALRGLPLTPAADIYAAGAILYRCIAGAPYVRLDGATREEARALILSAAPDPLPSGADPVLASVALRALAKDPDARYQNADAMLAALDEAPVRLAPTTSAASMAAS